MITPLTKQIVGTPCKLQRQPQRSPAQKCKQNCGVVKLFENTSEIQATYAGNASKIRGKYAEGGLRVSHVSMHAKYAGHTNKIRAKYAEGGFESCTAQATKVPGEA